MQPLYTEDEFKSAKSRQILPLKCLHCSKTFYRTKNDIKKSLLYRRKEKHNFCSNKCQRNHENPPNIITCFHCKKPLQRKPSQCKKSKHNFCSRSCSCTYNNAHKTKGTRISKLEVWLSTKLPILYPSLVFNLNQTDAINGELDIFIPSLKLAFELNGIFHYEPIYGEHHLNKRKTNDHRKMLACSEKGIELCVIDVSRQKYFKEKTSIQFLNIIQKIIDSKLSGSSLVN